MVLKFSSLKLSDMSIPSRHFEVVTRLSRTRDFYGPQLPLHENIRMSQHLLVVAAGLEVRHQPLEETAMFSRPKSISKSPRENKTMVRNTSVYWGDYGESGWKEGGPQHLGMLVTLLNE
jgi:hypothetical protein